MFNKFCYLQRIVSRLQSVTGDHTSVFSIVSDRIQAVVRLGWSARGESTARMIEVSKFVYIAQIYGLRYAILAARHSRTLRNAEFKPCIMLALNVREASVSHTKTENDTREKGLPRVCERPWSKKEVLAAASALAEGCRRHREVGGEHCHRARGSPSGKAGPGRGPLSSSDYNN